MGFLIAASRLMAGIDWKKVLAVIAIVLAVATSFFAVRSYNRAILAVEIEKNNAAEAQEVARKNIVAAEQIREQAERDMNAVAEDAKKRENAVEKMNQKLKEIANAPQTDDGPVAPVLRRSVDDSGRLREPEQP